MSSSIINYDQQTNSYFTLNKQTGQASKVYKNGTQLITFKPMYSGKDYSARKKYQTNLSPAILKRKAFLCGSQHHSIKNQRHLERKVKSLAILNKKVDSKRGPQKSFHSLIANMKLPVVGILQPKIKQYERIKQQIKNENHSPCKGYEGSKTTTRLISFFENETFQQEPRAKSSNKNFTINCSSPRSDSTLMNFKEQFKKEKQIYLQYNSNVVLRQNAKQKQQLKDQKINLKILERLFIEKSNRETKCVYGSC